MGSRETTEKGWTISEEPAHLTDYTHRAVHEQTVDHVHLADYLVHKLGYFIFTLSQWTHVAVDCSLLPANKVSVWVALSLKSLS